jgi:cysteine desulfurase
MAGGPAKVVAYNDDMDLIYLDNNATTPLLPAAWEAMRAGFLESFGNPGSAHRAGRRARQILEDARERIAALLGAHADEVVFTSGATEANNLALAGLAGEPPGQLIASPIEHPSAGEPLRQLARAGFALETLPVSSAGTVSASDLANLLRPETRLVAVMLANHETGAIQPTAELAGAIDGRTAFHCDAVQATGKIPINFHALGVTTLSLSAHKFHGPRGIGALLVRRGTRLRAMLHGGHQQQGRRPGTEPVALAAGMAVALDAAYGEMAQRTAHVRHLRQTFLEQLRANAEPVVLNGPAGHEGIPHTLNVSFPPLKGDALLMALDLAGVAASTGSACSSGSLLPSPVLQAMHVPDAVLRSAMRFSFSFLNTLAETDEAARRICLIVQRLRRQQDGE